MLTLQLLKDILQIVTMAVTLPLGVYRLCQIYEIQKNVGSARKGVPLD